MAISHKLRTIVTIGLGLLGMALVAFSLRPPTGKAPISSSNQQSDETSNGRSKEQAKEKKGEGGKLVEGRKGEGATALLPVPPAEGVLADGSKNVKKVRGRMLGGVQE